MSLINKICSVIFFLGVFFIPFNSFDGLSFLGEFSNEAAAFFFFAGFSLLFGSVLFGNKFFIPYKSILFQLVLVFLGWCIVATLLNAPTVWESYFKQTGGVARFIRQYLSLIISAIFFFLFYYNVIRKLTIKELFYKTRSVFLITLLFATFYSVFEIAILILNIGAAHKVIDLLNYFPFLEGRIYGDRISSVAYEVPFFAIYLITVAGWMFSYILTSKSYLRFIPAGLILILTFFSGSRTGLVVITIQVLVFLIVLLYNRKFQKYVIILFSLGVVGGTVIFAAYADVVLPEIEKKITSLDFRSNLTKSVSNQSRWGIQYASLQVFKEHPVVGVGYGQQAYHNRFHYPVWATTNNYEFRLIYKNQLIKSFPPGYNLYLRVLVETGIIGLLLFLSIVLLAIKKSSRLIKSKDPHTKIFGVVLLVSFVGAAFNFLQIDTFRLFGFWLFLAMLIKIWYDIKRNSQEKSPKVITKE